MAAPSQKTRTKLALFIEFVRFATGFAIIMMVALVGLHAAAASMH